MVPSDRAIYKDRHARIIIKCPESDSPLRGRIHLRRLSLRQPQTSCSPAADHTLLIVSCTTRRERSLLGGRLLTADEGHGADGAGSRDHRQLAATQLISLDLKGCAASVSS